MFPRLLLSSTPSSFQQTQNKESLDSSTDSLTENEEGSSTTSSSSSSNSSSAKTIVLPLWLFLLVLFLLIFSCVLLVFLCILVLFENNDDNHFSKNLAIILQWRDRQPDYVPASVSVGGGASNQKQYSPEQLQAFHKLQPSLCSTADISPLFTTNWDLRKANVTRINPTCPHRYSVILLHGLYGSGQDFLNVAEMVGGALQREGTVAGSFSQKTQKWHDKLSKLRRLDDSSHLFNYSGSGCSSWHNTCCGLVRNKCLATRSNTCCGVGVFPP